MDAGGRSELIEELCSFEGRGPGTDAERRAAPRPTDGDGRPAGDRPRTGGTGVTGVVDGLPRDDEPTTWPFPRR